MNSDILAEEKLRKLLVSAIDGEASDAELLRLNESLRTDENLRESAARFLCDDAFLGEEIGRSKQQFSS